VPVLVLKLSNFGIKAFNYHLSSLSIASLEPTTSLLFHFATTPTWSLSRLVCQRIELIRFRVLDFRGLGTRCSTPSRRLPLPLFLA
jgi:hypothetical protein